MDDGEHVASAATGGSNVINEGTCGMKDEAVTINGQHFLLTEIAGETVLLAGGSRRTRQFPPWIVRTASDPDVALLRRAGFAIEDQRNGRRSGTARRERAMRA